MKKQELYFGKQPENCPICGEKWEMQCRCALRERSCKNGHCWWNVPDKMGWIAISDSPSHSHGEE